MTESKVLLGVYILEVFDLQLQGIVVQCSAVQHGRESTTHTSAVTPRIVASSHCKMHE
jgi:hypothetical protein